VTRSAVLTKALVDVEKRIASRRTEKAVILDTNGAILFEKSGGASDIAFSESEIKTYFMKGLP
jgi:hypothetical protein